METVVRAWPRSDKRAHSRWGVLAGWLKELVRNRELLLVLAGRDLKVRYKQSLLGVAWAVLQPASMTFVFTIIFGRFAQVASEGKPYPLFSYVAMLPWSLLAAALSNSVTSLVANLSLVTKVKFPKEILVLAGIIACGVDFLIGFALLPILYLIWPVQLNVTLCWLPLLVAIQVLLTVGISLIIAAANVFYRDLRFIVPLGLQLWFFASPVIYSLSAVPGRFRALYLLNPMAPLLEGYRRVLLHGSGPQLSLLGPAAAISLALCIFGYWLFKRLEPAFADVI